MQKETRKKKQNSSSKKNKKMQKNAHAQPNLTHHLFGAFLGIFLHLHFFAFFVRFLALFLHFCAFFVRLFGDFFAVSQGNAQKMQKNHLKNANTKQKECKGKDQNVFDRTGFVF